MRCLEFYSGIGGFAVAAGALGWDIALAMDINHLAAGVYRGNFTHRHEIRTLESISPELLATVNAELWWMSPPCQPFTCRGRTRDLSDPRMESFSAVLRHLAAFTPACFAMENVPAFQTSQAADLLRTTLADSGYQWREVVVCPTALGIPNRRARFYLAACWQRLPAAFTFPAKPITLASILDPAPEPSLFVDDSWADQFAAALHCVRAEDQQAITSCFTSAYGKSPVHSGSYLNSATGLRRFAPEEILRLLGFPQSFHLPADLSLRQAWKLVGNSLSIPVLKNVLRVLTQRTPHEIVGKHVLHSLRYDIDRVEQL